MSACLPACLPACLYVCLGLSICPSVRLSVCLSVSMSACLPACLPACLSACLSLALSVSLSTSFSISISLYLSLPSITAARSPPHLLNYHSRRCALIAACAPPTCPIYLKATEAKQNRGSCQSCKKEERNTAPKSLSMSIHFSFPSSCCFPPWS